MADVKVVVRSEDGQSLESKITKFAQELSEKQLKKVAEETSEAMTRNINASLVRPGSTGNLAEHASKIEKTAEGYGVGNIETLNEKAKYWRWQNFGVAGTGRKIPPATKGSFQPGNVAPSVGSFRGGRFEQDGDGFLMVPTKPLEAKNYIERTISEIFLKIKTILNAHKI